MNAPKRSRARVLTPEGLQKLRERLRSHEAEANAGFKYSLERLGALTGLDPETVKNVLDCKGSDKRTIARCFESFGLTLEESDHIPIAQASAAIADPNFVGRDEAIADLNTLVSRNARVIVIQARGGVGKTTLARKYLQQAFGSFLEFPIAKETKDIASIEGLIEEKLRQLGEEPGREFLVSLDRLKRKLQAERIGILIDNLEPALDSAGKFIEAHRRYVELLRVLSDPSVQSLTLITSRERLREADVTVQHYPLRSLAVQAWEQFFQSRGIPLTPLADAGREVGGEDAVAALHNAYGGNAKAMDIISGSALEDFSGAIEAYWQANQDDLFIERDLEDLVTKQFDRLQQLDPDAYKLLCRMGCYRYQDVPTVPIEGLFCLLWDVPENRHRRVIKSLQDRSLIDFEDGKFWLHPVIRAEAIGRLKLIQDWEIANQIITKFWTESIESIEVAKDAFKALEPYYHCLAINDFENASNILRKGRHNRWDDTGGEGEPLCVSFYRLGLLQKIIFVLIPILNKIEPGIALGELLNMAGEIYHEIGNVTKAVNYYSQASEIASKFNDEYIKVVSELNKHSLDIDLWELENALRFFEGFNNSIENGEISISPSDESEFNRWPLYSWFYLAFLNSSLGFYQRATKFAQQVEANFSKTKMGPWGKGYSLFFLGQTYKNIGKSEKAFIMYEKAIQVADESHYLQVKAKALYGIAELYREQRNFDLSVSQNLLSIQILDEVGSKSASAEAYYQLGLTYRSMGEFDTSNKSFQEAIRLFSEMEAPKQVERVRQSMQNQNSN